MMKKYLCNSKTELKESRESWQLKEDLNKIILGQLSKNLRFIFLI